MDALKGVWDKILEFLGTLKLYLTMDLLMILVGALTLLAIILIIVMAARGRHYNRLLDRKQEISETANKAINEREARVAKKEQALMKREAELEKSERDLATAPKGERLPPSYSSFSVDESSSAFADIEHRRLLNEARRQAHDILRQADREYLEIISLAHDEAEFIRNRAGERHANAHESLKQSLKRANELIEEAHVEARAPAKPAFPAEESVIVLPVPEPDIPDATDE